MSLVGRRFTGLPYGPIRAPGVSEWHVQDPLTGYSWEHLDSPIGDLHPLLAGIYGPLQTFMATICRLPEPYSQEVRR
jgi:hypothetical protein